MNLPGLRACLLFALVQPSFAYAQTPAPVVPQKVIVDTDIGDDIDDAFALALALRSPELQILQINSDFGNTPVRAKIVDRFLASVGRADIPVATGVQSASNSGLSQRGYGDYASLPASPHPDAVNATLDLIRKYPKQITLIAIGPLRNVGAMIDRDPATFRQLKRVVLMGGSVDRGYGDLGYSTPHGPDAEWNIAQEVPGAQKLFTSGVQLDMMPLDATQLKLDEVKRSLLFKQGTPLTDQLILLYTQWGGLTPTLYDPMAVAFAIDPSLCPTTPLHIVVDAKGFTRRQPGAPNVNVCLRSSPDTFFDFFMPRLMKP